jgi:signal transduction histidine kinase
MFGCRDENDFISRSPAGLSPDYQPDGAKSSDKAQEMIVLALEKGSNFFEWRHKRVDGTEFPATVLLSRMEKGGKAFLLATVRDITLQKNAENELVKNRERLTNVLDSLDSLVYVADLDSYELLFINKYGREMFGDLRGQKCWQLIQKGKNEPCSFCTNDKLMSASGIPTGVYQWEFQNTVNGKWYDCRDQAIPWTGKKLVRMEIATDITSRKNREEELKLAYFKLKETQTQLIQSEKMETVGRLASGVAHEVKNPLAIILQGIEFLQTSIDKNNEKIHSTLDFMDKAVSKADHVIKGLLDFSCKPIIGMEANDLTGTIEKAIGLLDFSFKKHKIEVIKVYESGIPKITMNKDEMEQVFVNIFMNAIDAMPSGGKLTIKTYLKESDQVGDGVGRRVGDIIKLGEKAVLVEIEDTGLGIPENMVSKLFEPFFTTRRDKGGTGLGLSIVGNIILQHGGNIKIANKPEGGVKVSLVLKT